ncbi:MAG: hypothetical protein GC162_00205 [Planctomycetes bacterium]|nr:hypothetical protein [Planctomycetota bacterium]
MHRSVAALVMGWGVMLFVLVARVPAGPPISSKSVVTDVADIFDGLPADAQPANGKWSDAAVQKAGQWLRTSGANRRCQLLIPIRFARAFKAPSPTEPGRDWRVMLTLDPKLFDFHGLKVSYDAALPPTVAPNEAMYQVTEAVGKNVEKIAPGDLIQVRGIITNIKLGSNDDHAWLSFAILNPDIDLHPKVAAAKSDKPAAAKNDKPDNAPAKSTLTDRPFANVAQLFAPMPADVGPAPGKPLDRDTTGDVNNWLGQHCPEKPVRMMVKIDHVRLTQDKNPGGDPALKWTVAISLANEDVKFRAIDVNVNFKSTSIYGFQMQGDDAFAKRMEQIPKGRPTLLEGTIRNVLFTAYVPTKANLAVTITDFKFPNIK